MVRAQLLNLKIVLRTNSTYLTRMSLLKLLYLTIVLVQVSNDLVTQLCPFVLKLALLADDLFAMLLDASQSIVVLRLQRGEFLAQIRVICLQFADGLSLLG